MTLKITTADIRRELERRKYRKIDGYFPDTGPFRRELYHKHLDFFKAGAVHRERAMIAANRVGKTDGAGGYELTCHLTGIYPWWWPGRRFSKPVNFLVGGETGMLVRDSIQLKLLGELHDIGTGMIPKEYIESTTPKSGIPKAVGNIYVKHISGGVSTCQLQSYDQGREVFQATERDGVWFDEEPPIDIYTEGLIRTMTTKGIVMSTFTPLKGVSETVLHLQKQAKDGVVTVISATWDDAPHLSDEDKEELMRSLPPHQRDARSKGIPSLGSGAVYPIPESDFTCEPFELPKHYKRCYGMDVGWNNTASLWLATDPDTDVTYAYAEYKRGQAEPSVHAATIRAKGDWIHGVIDPASRGRAQKDGEQLIYLYQQQGLKIIPASNAVESGIFDVYEKMTVGKLKIFSNLTETLAEIRLYRRDDKGRIVKEFDHLMDCLRYGIVSGLGVATIKPIAKAAVQEYHASGDTWMAG
ncbi:terminase family protein [Hymenobacter sp. BT186]|uniref:Terminase family protein n=1 Tax=Hymenobacter telluris TaxID=2816474 RepID=A0A939EVJ3_9BACT|nr:terminase family protein [Hymenobacter telluris]MBO0358619.1 terminase family protein [Hymenobacter telluris]MBW3374645.1 terminase family protein [Hymenobacter norwichensis]